MEVMGVVLQRGEEMGIHGPQISRVYLKCSRELEKSTFLSEKKSVCSAIGFAQRWMRKHPLEMSSHLKS